MLSFDKDYNNDNDHSNDNHDNNHNNDNSSNIDVAKHNCSHVTTTTTTKSTISNMNKEFLLYSTIYAYHLLYNHNLKVKITILPNCNFNGLYTKKFYCYNEVICQYYGDKMRTIEAIRLKDKSYLMRLGEQCYIDAKNYPLIYAR
jgi:hypothetical protein